MLVYEVRREIAAPTTRVWAILTDAAQLVAGPLGVKRIDGHIAAGARLVIWSEAAPGRGFPTRVAEFSPPARMVWTGGMPLGLFRGVRAFNLTPNGAGAIFHMREEFSGPMLGLIEGSMPDLNPSFAIFADGLKLLAEA